jgi:hypothetical protein
VQSDTKERTLDAFAIYPPFALHILPKGFVRTRQYGILSSTSKAACALSSKTINGNEKGTRVGCLISIFVGLDVNLFQHETSPGLPARV